MKHTRAALVAGLSLAATSVGALVPAHADEDTTDVTFTLSGGGLSVTAPASKDLSGSGLTLGIADSVTGQLGTVEVNDSQGNLTGGWTATVTSSDFVNGTSSIAKANVQYGTGVITFNGVGAGAGVTALPVPAPAVNDEWTITAVALGNSVASWNPTVAVSIPSTGVAQGLYSGTITHSVL